MSYYGFPRYVPVAERREKAKRKIEKLRKKGKQIFPVEIEKRKIAHSFWGKAWCDHIESFSDYENRLPRGRTYVRNGSVCHLQIMQGKVEAIVSGSSLYNVRIQITALPDDKWTHIKTHCSGKIGSLIDLLNGKLSDGVMQEVCDRNTGLFPLSNDIQLSCDCSDWATMCKHVAAVLYGVGARLDQSPEQLFQLRGVDHNELIDVSTAVIDATQQQTSSRRRIDDHVISDVFGIDMTDQGSLKQEAPALKQSVSKPKQPKRQARKKPVSKKSVKTKQRLPKYFSGTSIRRKRVELGLTQSEFGKLLGVSVSSISRWENFARRKVAINEQSKVALQKLWK